MGDRAIQEIDTLTIRIPMRLQRTRPVKTAVAVGNGQAAGSC